MLKRFRNSPELPELSSSVSNKESALAKSTVLPRLGSETLALAKALIRCPSITPDDAGANQMLMTRLQKLGFVIEEFNKNGVKNFVATYGDKKPVIAFCGHTDVVPPGHKARWQTPPFEPMVKDGFLYGRGASDMKGGLAAFVVAIENFLKQTPSLKATLMVLITSDEEGEAKDGSAEIVRQLQQQGKTIDYAIIGEPTSAETLADSIRIGRRGSINCRMVVSGKQGHVGYPEQLINPIHASSKLVYKLANKRWDMPSRYFPSTSFQLVSLESKSGAMNVTPANLEMAFNLRYSPRSSYSKIKSYVEKKAQKYGLEAQFEWQHEAKPYLTKRGKLRKTVQKVILEELGYKPKLTTGGGISDGRYIKQIAKQVIELGPSNKTIHQTNERVSVEELARLTGLYQKIIKELLG